MRWRLLVSFGVWRLISTWVLHGFYTGGIKVEYFTADNLLLWHDVFSNVAMDK